MSDLSLKQLEKQLTCSICLDHFKQPKLLPCQHTFCAQPCLKNLLDLHAKRVRCPECRTSHTLPTQGGIDALPNNLTILGFLDLYAQKSYSESLVISDKCYECSQRRDNLTKCIDCSKTVCPNCKSIHRNHIINEIQQNLPSLRRAVPILSEKVGYFEQKNRLVEQNLDSIRHDISANFEKLIEELKKRESQLLSEAETFVQSQLRTMSLEKKNAQVDLASLSSLCDSAENTISRSDENELAILKKQVSNYMEQLRNYQGNVVANKIQFTSINYNQLLNSIQNFGDLTTSVQSNLNNSISNESQPFGISLNHKLFDFSSQLPPQQTQRKRRTWNQKAEDLLSSNTRPSSRPIFGSKEEGSESTLIEQPRRPKSRPIFGASAGTGSQTMRAIESQDRDCESFEKKGSQTDRYLSPPQVIRQGTFTVDQTQQQPRASRRARSPMSFNVMLDEQNSLQFDMPDAASVFNTQNSSTSSNPRVNYSAKKKPKFQFGKQGRDLSELIWPLGIAISPLDQTILVVDSNNHRVQVFEPNGLFLQSFGTHGKRVLQFDCPTCISIDSMGNIFVSDKQNHRIQVFDRYFRFIRVLGNGPGTAPGQLTLPYGLSVSRFSEVFIAENDRISVFHLNGRFVRAFGVTGNRPGQFDKPSYVHVTNENRVLVSDTSNHRIQVFDPYGSLLINFGVEGTQADQMRLPRGIASNSEGFIFVADSGNSRIQVYKPDGSHVYNFPNDHRFKALEGICLLSNGDIACVDRDSHKVQIF